MTRGRKPKATAIKEQGGAFAINPNRRNVREPKVKPVAPRVPPMVKACKIAHAKWKHVVKLLTEMKVISTADQDLIESYSLAYKEIMENVEALRLEGQLVVGSRGDMVKNPRTSIVKGLREHQHKLLAEMGLTPSARTRLQARPDEEVDVLTELIKRRASLN